MTTIAKITNRRLQWAGDIYCHSSSICWYICREKIFFSQLPCLAQYQHPLKLLYEHKERVWVPSPLNDERHWFLVQVSPAVSIHEHEIHNADTQYMVYRVSEYISIVVACYNPIGKTSRNHNPLASSHRA